MKLPLEPPFLGDFLESATEALRDLTMQYSTVQYSTGYSIAQDTVQFSTVQYNIVQDTVQYSTGYSTVYSTGYSTDLTMLPPHPSPHRLSQP